MVNICIIITVCIILSSCGVNSNENVFYKRLKGNEFNACNVINLNNLPPSISGYNHQFSEELKKCKRGIIAYRMNEDGKLVAFSTDLVLSEDELSQLLSIKSLQKLQLFRQYLRVTHFDQLSTLPQLAELDVRESRLEKHFAEFSRIPALERLGVSWTTFPSIRNDHQYRFSHLVEIDATGIHFDIADIQMLSVSAPSLRMVNFREITASEETLKGVSSLQQIFSLSLSNVELPAGMLEQIMQMQSLRSINLSQTSTSDSDIKVIASLPSLEIIRLNNCKNIDGSCLEFLKANPRIQQVFLGGSQSPVVSYQRFGDVVIEEPAPKSKE